MPGATAIPVKLWPVPTALISLASLYTSKAQPESALVLLARAQALQVDAPLLAAACTALRVRERALADALTA